VALLVVNEVGAWEWEKVCCEMMLAERERCLQIVEGGDYPRQRDVYFRADKRPTKHDQCPHGLTMKEDCSLCEAEAIRNGYSPAAPISGEELAALIDQHFGHEAQPHVEAGNAVLQQVIAEGQAKTEAMEWADTLRELARTDRDAEGRVEEHDAWRAADFIERHVGERS
jgi:hypothetical protein